MSESQRYADIRGRDAARPANIAAWMRKRRGAIEIGPASYTPPGEQEIVVKNAFDPYRPR
jgi:hypothetical protein